MKTHLGPCLSVPEVPEVPSLKFLKFPEVPGKAEGGGGGADIGPLIREGVPGLSPSTVGLHYFDWHHTGADTVDKVNPEDFRKNIAVPAVLTYILADMPDRLAGSKVAGGE